MEIFKNPAVIWFFLGFVFFILEFLVPGFILFFFAIAAWIVALIVMMFDISLNVQLIVFVISAVATILFFRKWLQKIMLSKKHTTQLEHEFIGKIAIAETAIGPDKEGKVDFRGTSWNARSEDNIHKGDHVVITGNESIVLIVKQKQ
jgi:membrane protein implicated in regulation of membrane protease activity